MTQNTATQNSQNVTPSSAQEVSKVLHDATFFPIADCSNENLRAGNRYCRLIKRGDNSKLSASVAVELPALSAAQFGEYIANPVIHELVTGYIEKLQDEYIKGRAIAGAAGISYSEVNVANVAEYLASQGDGSGGFGQLSEERIAAWFEQEARELLIVAFADRLGMSQDVSDAEVKKLEQLANQTRDNLKKLASRKPVVFDTRVHKALEWALDVTDAGEVMTAKLRGKLNMPATAQEDLLANLGF